MSTRRPSPRAEAGVARVDEEAVQVGGDPHERVGDVREPLVVGGPELELFRAQDAGGIESDGCRTVGECNLWASRKMIAAPSCWCAAMVTSGWNETRLNRWRLA